MSIREALLEKAVRDTSKLVQVKRTVSRGGKTFTQMYWVKPSQVKKTDQVVGGQQNVQGAGQKPAPSNTNQAAQQNSSFDKAQFDSLAKTDRTKAMDYLKSCGISWKENAHAGINWMRAMQAAKKSGSQTQAVAQNIPAQPKQTQPKPAQAKQPSGSGAKLDSKVQSALQSCNTGKDCVAVLKQHLGPDGCMDYARKLGVTWKESNHAGINQMRMSMALNKHFSNNLPKNSTQASSSQSQSPSAKTQNTNTAKKDDNKPKGKVGAPKGNQNAKKDGVKADDATKKDEPKAKSDELEIPKNATQRQKNIINLINKVTDIDQLKSYAAVGMIGEDDVANNFILDKLAPKYVSFVASVGLDTDIDPETGISNALTKDIAELARESGASENSGYALNAAIQKWYSEFRVSQVTDPRKSLSTSMGAASIRGSEGEAIQMHSFLSTIIDAYSTNASDEHKDSNVGYSGWDTTESRKNWKEESDGFIKAVKKIAEKDNSLKSEAERMITEYKQLMESVDYNYNVLKDMLGRASWKEYTRGSRGSVRDIQGVQPTQGYDYATQANQVEYLMWAIPEILEKKGFSKKEVFRILERNTTSLRDNNENLKTFRAADWRSPDIDLTTAVDSSGKPYFKNNNLKYLEEYHPPVAAGWMIRLVMDKYKRDNPELKDEEYEYPDLEEEFIAEAKEKFEKAKTLGGVSSATWEKFRLHP